MKVDKDLMRRFRADRESERERIRDLGKFSGLLGIHTYLGKKFRDF